jgi:hypothetical protein
LAAPLGLLAACLARAAAELPWLHQEILTRYPKLTIAFLAQGIPNLLHAYAWIAGVCAVVLLFSSVTALLVRRFWALWVLHKCYIFVYVLFVFYVYSVTKISSLFMEANVAINGATPTQAVVFFFRWHYLWPALLAVFITAGLHILSWRRTVFVLYTGIHDETPAIGDKILRNLLHHGRDPRFRKSTLASVGVHLFVIFVLPWLLGWFGHVTPYRVPKGSGTPTAAATVKAQRCRSRSSNPRPVPKRNAPNSSSIRSRRFRSTSPTSTSRTSAKTSIPPAS